MDVDESAGKHGDVSPIALAEDAKTAPKRKEPSSEELSNFARVTPAQLAYVSFPATGRYQPVRPVASRSAGKARVPRSGGERYAAGGGILMLEDRTPDVDGQFLEFETQALPRVTTTYTSAAPTDPPLRHSLNEDEPDAEVPPSFEVSPGSYQ
jgi:26S proteasome regulatory subunit N2